LKKIICSLLFFIFLFTPAKLYVSQTIELNQKVLVRSPNNSAFPDYWWVSTPVDQISLAEGVHYIPNWTAAFSSSYTTPLWEMKKYTWNEETNVWDYVGSTSGSFANNTQIDLLGEDAKNLNPGIHNWTLFLDFDGHNDLMVDDILFFILNKTTVFGAANDLKIFQSASFEVKISFLCPGEDIELTFVFSDDLLFDIDSLENIIENFTLFFEISVNNSIAITADSIVLIITFDDGIEAMLQQFLTLYYWNVGKEQWEPLSGGEIDVDWVDNILTVYLDHFSIYAFGYYIPNIDEDKEKEGTNDTEELFVTIPFSGYFLLFIGIGIVMLLLQFNKNQLRLN